MRPELDLAKLLEVLNRHGVRYVLIGGIASVIHGSPFPTEDVDITPEGSPDNLRRLSDALRELAAKVRAEDLEEPLPFVHDADSLAAVHVWNLSTRYGDLDLSFVPAGTSGYDDLARDATEMPLYGVTVTVASLADVIRSKQAANRPKDQRVLPTLREILASRHEDTSRRRSQG
jgi:predicted nucleotidyltransferase